MKVYLKGGSVLEIDISKHTVYINSNKIGFFDYDFSKDPWEKTHDESMLIPLCYVEKIEL